MTLSISGIERRFITTCNNNTINKTPVNGVTVNFSVEFDTIEEANKFSETVLSNINKKDAI